MSLLEARRREKDNVDAEAGNSVLWSLLAIEPYRGSGGADRSDGATL